MNRSKCLIVACSCVVAGFSARAQSSPSANTAHEVIGNGGLIHSLLAAPVTGEPYSAVQTTRTKQTLADGTTVTHGGHHSVARDAEGRVRVERRLTNGRDGKPETILVFVMDPVARTLTTWVNGGADPKSGTHVASIVKLPKDPKKEEPAKAQPAVDTTRPQLVVTTEDLGTDTFEGQAVTVTKTTTILPAGRAGNDAPITRTREVWTSPELKLVLKEQWNDPRTGEKTVELDKLSRIDPDPALFRAPAGYQVKSALETLKELEEKLEQSQQN